MRTIKKSLVLACAASLLSLGAAMAQTDPNAAPAAPAAPGAEAPAMQDATAPAAPAKPMKKMTKKHSAKKKHKVM